MHASTRYTSTCVLGPYVVYICTVEVQAGLGACFGGAWGAGRGCAADESGPKSSSGGGRGGWGRGEGRGEEEGGGILDWRVTFPA